MKLIRTLTIIIALTAFCAGTAWTAPQTNCPVMGGPINPKIYTDYEGRRIYFCCSGCVNTFKKDPAKYIAKVDAEIKGGASEEKKKDGGCQKEKKQGDGCH